MRGGEKVQERRKYSRGEQSGRRPGEVPFRSGTRNAAASTRKDSLRFRRRPEEGEFGSGKERSLRREAVGVLDYDEVNVDTFSDVEDSEVEEMVEDFDPSGVEDVFKNLAVDQNKLLSNGYSGDDDSYLTDVRYDFLQNSSFSVHNVLCIQLYLIQMELLLQYIAVC